MDDSERISRAWKAALVRQNKTLRDELAEARLLLSQECATVGYWRAVVAAITRRAGGELRIPRSDVVWTNPSELLVLTGDDFDRDVVLRVGSAPSPAPTSAAPNSEET